MAFWGRSNESWKEEHMVTLFLVQASRDIDRSIPILIFSNNVVWLDWEHMFDATQRAKLHGDRGESSDCCFEILGGELASAWPLFDWRRLADSQEIRGDLAGFQRPLRTRNWARWKPGKKEETALRS